MTFSLNAQYHYEISKITPQIQKRMIEGNSYHKGCPVSLNDLRYLKMTYTNFIGQDATGELIVHKEVADDVVEIFKALYEQRYPIRQMRLVSDFGGNDWLSIEADNTSAFNCRNATGSKTWSRHAYGKAIDLNPLENPYISSSGRISHKASLKFRIRKHRLNIPQDRAVLLQNDRATQLFKQHGWRWGGEFRGEKDYQHFAK